MALALYHLEGCPRCEKVRLALELESLDYESLAIEDEDRSEVERISGQSSVPVLVEDDGSVVFEANRIVHHLASAEGSRLLPSSRRERALARVLAERADAILGPVCDGLITAEAPGGGTLSEEEVRELRRQLEGELTLLEGILEGGPYLFGGRPSVADIGAHAYLNRIPPRYRLPAIGEFPRTSDWFRRVQRAAGRPATGEEG